jgi:hypothetical protein
MPFTEGLQKNDICRNGACPVECLPNEMFTPLNACPMKYGVNFIGAKPVFLGRILFHRGCPATPLKMGFNRGEAHQGQVEVVFPDGTRCDCVTDTHAIEFDFGNNWAEAVGQSAYYAIQTGKKAGIVLILETVKDRKYWIRLNTTIERFNLPIDTWPIGNTEY